MSGIAPSCRIIGEVEGQEDLTLDGSIEGNVWCEAHAVTIGPAATVVGNIVARDITLRGSVSGDLVATEVVQICAGARLTGRVVAPRLILEDGGWMQATVEPQQVTAALKVARYRRRAATDDRQTV